MALGEPVFRRFKRGDEEGVVEVIRSAMPIFEAYGLEPEEWLMGGGGASPENTYVAEADGRILSVVQVALKRQFFAEPLTTAGIANVSTMPGYRGKGLATRLLQYALSDMAERGVRVAGLFAGLGSRAYRIYLRLGFTPIHVFQTPVCMKGDLRRAAEYCWMRAGRSWSMSGGSAEQLYSSYHERYRGLVARDRGYWDWVWRMRPWYTWFRLGPEGYKLVELSGGRGYMLYASWSRTRLAGTRDRRMLHVGEMLYGEPADACMLLEMMIREVEREDACGAVFHTPLDYWFLRPCLSKAPGETFMLRAPRTPPQLVPRKPGASGIWILVDGEKICVPRNSCIEKNVELRLPRDTLYRILAGALSPGEAADMGLMHSRPRGELWNAVRSLEEILGSRQFHVWMTDRW